MAVTELPVSCHQNTLECDTRPRELTTKKPICSVGTEDKWPHTHCAQVGTYGQYWGDAQRLRVNIPGVNISGIGCEITSRYTYNIPPLLLYAKYSDCTTIVP